MDNCLVLKLDCIVNDDNLEEFGIVKIKVPAGANITNAVNIFGSSTTGAKFQFSEGITVVSAKSDHTDYTSQGEAPCSVADIAGNVVTETSYDISSVNEGWLKFNKKDYDLTCIGTGKLVNVPVTSWCYLPTISIVSYARQNPEGLNVDISLLKNATNLRKVEMTCKCFGNMSDLGVLTKLFGFSGCLDDNIKPTGTIEDMLDGMVANGRTSGNLNMWIGKIPYNNIVGNRQVKVTFDSDGWHQTN